jgi:hypothetical protein
MNVHGKQRMQVAEPFHFDPILVLSLFNDSLLEGFGSHGTDGPLSIVVHYGGYLGVASHFFFGRISEML